MAHGKVEQRMDEFDRVVVMLNKLLLYQQSALRQLDLISQAKKCLMAKLLK